DGDVQVGGLPLENLEEDIGEIEIHDAAPIGALCPVLEPPGAELPPGSELPPSARSVVRATRSGDACDLGDRRLAELDLLEAVLRQASHAVADAAVGDAVGGGALDRQRADLVGHRHHLIEAEPSLVARAAAAAAAGRLEGLDVDVRREAVV